ncbi:hypothetical protein TUSST3_07940 [Streptomyces sp. TUS-ST3]|nr:hypothetical protein TUSST3_07940 [Streptomyces sp. TUS-ST3]
MLMAAASRTGQQATTHGAGARIGQGPRTSKLRDCRSQAPPPKPSPKIRTTCGPAPANLSPTLSFTLVKAVRMLYHQQTKNLLVSYSPKKLGFF